MRYDFAFAALCTMCFSVCLHDFAFAARAQVAKEAWGTFSNLNKKQGAKSYMCQEGACSEGEYGCLKHAMLKNAISVSEGRRERMRTIINGSENIAAATRKEAANLIEASLGKCSELLGKASTKSVSQLKRNTCRRAPAKDIFEGLDLTVDGDEWGEVSDGGVHGRPSSKKARMTLTRDAEEDADIEGYSSDGAEEARSMLDSSEKKRNRGRQQTKKDRLNGLSSEFRSIFREIKDVARHVPAPAPPAPPPVPNEMLNALLASQKAMTEMATMYFQKQMERERE
jgi:hypothetical protein